MWQTESCHSKDCAKLRIARVKIPLKDSWIWIMIQIGTKNWMFVTSETFHPFQKFHNNSTMSSVITKIHNGEYSTKRFWDPHPVWWWSRSPPNSTGNILLPVAHTTPKINFWKFEFFFIYPACRQNKKLSWCWQTRVMRLEVSQT